ncbi:MAG TPA: hypothetical protein VF111_11425 [Thermoanaerobaculia bacterium]
MATTTSKNNLQGQSVTLTFKPGVKKEEINAALEKIYLEAGCLACGLVGFDLDFKVAPVNPAFDRLRVLDLKGVTNISVQPIQAINANINVRG